MTALTLDSILAAVPIQYGRLKRCHEPDPDIDDGGLTLALDLLGLAFPLLLQ